MWVLARIETVAMQATSISKNIPVIQALSFIFNTPNRVARQIMARAVNLGGIVGKRSEKYSPAPLASTEEIRVITDAFSTNVM